MNPTIDDRVGLLEGDVAILQKVVSKLLPEQRPEDREFGGDLIAWVDRWLLARLERPLTHGSSGVAWCARWSEHPEVLARLEALRDSWVEARLGSGGALASWWVERADPTLRVVLAADGPFARCREQHRAMPALPSATAGEGGR